MQRRGARYGLKRTAALSRKAFIWSLDVNVARHVVGVMLTKDPTGRLTST
jgi:hypothetical protein